MEDKLAPGETLRDTKMEKMVQTSVPSVNGKTPTNCCESNGPACGQTNGKLQESNRIGQSNNIGQTDCVGQTNCVGQSDIAKNGHSVKSNGHPPGQRNGRMMRNGRMSIGRMRRMRRPWGWVDWLILAFGLGVGVGVGAAYAWLLYMLHENTLWFTHIKVSTVLNVPVTNIIGMICITLFL